LDRFAARFYQLSGHWRWLILSILVGLVSGVGALVFEGLLQLAFQQFIVLPTGYHEPRLGMPVEDLTKLFHPRNIWLIFIPAIGGLISGLLVFLIAPEAEGHGTDAMIDAFHQKGGLIRRRVPFVKIAASAITIGSGGSAGKEGPIAQIGAGFGSFLATALKLRARERRILVLAGAAGGIGAIFRAPLGAALFAPEVLYRDTELEYEAILPCLISSIVSYSLFTQVTGRAPLFFSGKVDFLPIELVAYIIFGAVCAGVGYIYVRLFYGMRDYFFHRLPIAKIVRPALGGLILGLIAYSYPQIMDGGYGWVQAAMDGNLVWHLMLLLVFLKIAATSCTISSGGSGGVFGPSVFIGAMLGGAFGFWGHQLAPGWVVHPSSFVLVGIGGFFAGVAKVPISSIIMACEMTGSYTLLVPLMLVSTVSMVLLRHTSLYEKQVPTRLASPAHLVEFARGLLGKMYVHEAVKPRQIMIIPDDMPFKKLVKVVTHSTDNYFPIVNHEGKMTGIISINDIREFMFEEAISNLVVARDVATLNVVSVSWTDTLQAAMDKMNELQIDAIPVVNQEDPEKIISMLSKRDIINSYYERTGIM
jgi:CIC family chloride channel protein